MSTNPAYVYQRRVLHSFARLAEIVQLSRPLGGGSVQIVTVKPLIVPAAATIATTTSSGTTANATSGGATGATGTATPVMAQADYDGFNATVAAGGGSVILTLPAPNSADTTSSIVPALIIGQDVFQAPAAVGDTFTRDGHGYTVRSVADQLVAGLVIAVLSIATAT